MTRHCMLDLETLGNKAGCVVLSIGACIFDADGVIPGLTFHKHLLVQPQIDAGMHMDPGTVMWWLGQSKEAQQAICDGQKNAVHPTEALEHFAGWYTQCGAERIWGNGADFDMPILNHAYRANCRREPPWKYNAGRCVRTIFQLISRKLGDFGTANSLAHDALSDAIFQAHEVSGAMRVLEDWHADSKSLRNQPFIGGESQ